MIHRKISAIPAQKLGFTLTEVITAIIVMSMMLVAVIGFVDYSSSIWQKGTAKVNAKNYTRMTFDLLKQDLNRASSVEVELPDLKGNNKIKYEIGAQTITLEVDEYRVLKKSINVTPKKTSVLARNVETFYVNRLSTWTFQITLSIYEENEEGDPTATGNKTIIGSETMILTAPGLS